jgi:hypothetical protein
MLNNNHILRKQILLSLELCHLLLNELKSPDYIQHPLGPIPLPTYPKQNRIFLRLESRELKFYKKTDLEDMGRIGNQFLYYYKK